MRWRPAASIRFMPPPPPPHAASRAWTIGICDGPKPINVASPTIQPIQSRAPTESMVKLEAVLDESNVATLLDRPVGASGPQQEPQHPECAAREDSREVIDLTHSSPPRLEREPAPEPEPHQIDLTADSSSPTIRPIANAGSEQADATSLPKERAATASPATPGRYALRSQCHLPLDPGSPSSPPYDVRQALALAVSPVRYPDRYRPQRSRIFRGKLNNFMNEQETAWTHRKRELRENEDERVKENDEKSAAGHSIEVPQG